MVPEVGLKLGVQVTDHIRVFGGWNWMYWTNVIRTGDVIDLRVNSSQLPPPGVTAGELYPKYQPTSRDMYITGLMLGLELRY
jgi:hypothetical protein